MRGIFSATPGQPAIRLLVGTHLLLIVQAWLVLCSAQEFDRVLRVIITGITLLGLLAFVAAVHGGSGTEAIVWRPRRAKAPDPRNIGPGDAPANAVRIRAERVIHAQGRRP